VPGEGTRAGMLGLPSAYVDSRDPTILPGVVASLAGAS
jgi:hypothetical protein